MTRTVNKNRLIYQAKSFYNAAINLERIDRESGDLLFLTPTIVNAAFSIEITLKAILTCEGITYENEHNIMVLYSLLPESAQALIWKWVWTKAPEYDVEKCVRELILISDAFKQWRYSFEDGIKPALDTRFLMCFANAAIGTMFELGYNVDVTPVGTEMSTDEIERVERMYEDNRREAIEKNLAYIRRKLGTPAQ